MRMNRWLEVAGVVCVGMLLVAAARRQEMPADAAYKNPRLPVEERVNDLISRMTLEEKVSQLGQTADAIPRLGVPEYNWWNEGLHGVARAGTAVVFPQAIGLAATFDEPWMKRLAEVISTEFRAKYAATRHADGGADWYRGLTVWSPNINIFRDPRWGRGQETYGEDPYLTARMGVAFVTGLQGDDPLHWKVVATPKHFAVHSGPEATRHEVDVQVSRHDMEETYLPAFRATVMEAHAGSVMCAYNSVNGQPACGNMALLEEHLRKDWGFQGYVVSDCGAIADIPDGHHFTKTIEGGVAAAFEAGTDLVCGSPRTRVQREREALIAAMHSGILPESVIDRSLRRLFMARFRLGMFDPPALDPYSRIAPSEFDTEDHRRLALETARKSIVLLKNEGGMLPIQKTPGAIAVIGPNADNLDALVGNYAGTPGQPVTVLAGIRARFPEARVEYVQGTGLVGPLTRTDARVDEERQAVEAAKRADLVVAVMGLSPRIEGEEMEVHAEGFSGGDRTSLDLPKPQERLLELVTALRKPTVLVLMSGSAVAVNWADAHVPAILEAWYPGGEGGTAVAEALAGDFSPAGRLPITFYKSIEQLPPFDDYSMAKRTYRYFGGKPLYPFGYGLSYTKFEYGRARVGPEEIESDETVTVSVEVKNTGAMDGEEVVELYLRHAGFEGAPIRALSGFSRVTLHRGETRTVTFSLGGRALSMVDREGHRRIVPGKVEVWVGGGQPGGRAGLKKAAGAKAEFVIHGERGLPD